MPIKFCTNKKSSRFNVSKESSIRFPNALILSEPTTSAPTATLECPNWNCFIEAAKRAPACQNHSSNVNFKENFSPPRKRSHRAKIYFSLQNSFHQNHCCCSFNENRDVFFVFPPALADFGIWYLFIRQTKGAFSLLPATNFHKRNPREEKKRLKFSRYFVRSFSEENTMLWAKSYPGREVVENFFSENCRRFTVGREFSWWHKSFNLNANMARDLTATWGKVGGFGRKRKTFKT